jgi:dihydrofolate synthase/folylpolyglutamate synthase
MRYPESVEYLYALGNEIKSAKFGLEGITLLLDALDNPQYAFRVVHVAGTNGKGSTCAMIEAALRNAGYRTGLFTSPHLVEPTERIQIAGRQVTRDQFTAAFAEVHEAAEQLAAAGVLEHHTTYFETVTAMAFVLFRQLNVEVAAVEVGLGGRLDATNTVRPELCVITPIDFDHERFLGNSIESIAGEKAGILKPGVPAVFARQRPEADAVLDARANELQAPVIRTRDLTVTDMNIDAYGSEFAVDGAHVRCPLAGRHQVENALAAFAALRHLGVPPDFSNTAWPARLERIQTAPEIVLDGAHNPAGARSLAAHLREFYADRDVWIVFGAMRDKAVEEITDVLFPLAHELVLTAPAQARALRPEALEAAVDHPRIRIAPTAREALDIARSAPPTTAVFITGSLYLAGEIRALLVE